MRLRFSDTEWLVPFAGITAGLLVTDRDVSSHLSHDPATLSHYNNFLMPGSGRWWVVRQDCGLLSYPSRNEHWRETGLLAGQAAVNSLVAVEALKYSLGRERPLQGDGSGHFFQGGTSFPSEHAAAAWAVAGVIGHEYPGPLPKLLAYGLASVVSYSRIRVRATLSMRMSLLAALWAALSPSRSTAIIMIRTWEATRGAPSAMCFVAMDRSSPQNQGSPYVPLDSWVYPALDRLAGFGLIDSGFAGMRPWTRRECARLLSEAENTWPTRPTMNDDDGRELSPRWNANFVRRLEGTEGGDGGAFRVESCVQPHRLHLRHSTAGWLSLCADADQRFWTSLRPRLEQHYRLFDLCHERPMGKLFPRRMAEFVGFAGFCPWRRGK